MDNEVSFNILEYLNVEKIVVINLKVGFFKKNFLDFKID